jgi:galactokinase/mevalonate kinase-like predicted kinase
MADLTNTWDYLIVTASNDQQAHAYRSLLDVRGQLGLLAGVRQWLVLPDPGGKRVGSGGSTIWCLMQVLGRELPADKLAGGPAAWQQALEGLRILIMHAGGDSKRLPAYAPVGKIFVPVPGESDSAIGATLFDRQLPIYLGLPAGGAGQVVVTSGDVLLRFDPRQVKFAPQGLTGLGCPASPQESAGHGVFCADAGGLVRRFLQKPTPQQQSQHGAVDRYGRSVLDVGVMNFDAEMARRLLELSQVAPKDGRLAWTGQMAAIMPQCGLDFYLEIACALGAEATFNDYRAALVACGSKLDEPLMRQVFDAMAGRPFHVQVLGQCEFLHFGTTRQIISSGLDLLRADSGSSQLEACISINNDLTDGALVGAGAWVEGCRIQAPVKLAGDNVLVGADVDEPLAMPRGGCLDVVAGRDGHYIRLYGVGDTFKTTVPSGATFCNVPVMQWLSAVGASAEDVWPENVPSEKRTLWDARLFVAERDSGGYKRWLWMLEPSFASAQQKARWLAGPRYSLAEMAELTDQQAFHHRRSQLRARQIAIAPRRVLRPQSEFSAAELAWTLRHVENPAALVADVLAEAQWYDAPGGAAAQGIESLNFSRVIHSLGSAIAQAFGEKAGTLEDALGGLSQHLRPSLPAWLANQRLRADQPVADWTQRAKHVAFEHMASTIVSSGQQKISPPSSALRSDEIVWGRAPARLDLGGGWTDTPPYALEHGGCVINAAVDLNGQPPIHCYARVTPVPVIRISSIDLGRTVEIHELSELLDYRTATGEFALAKAALAISGLSPGAASWPEGITLCDMLKHFGGGIELTTLAAIPKGSGLGTSSIVGAVILATVQRLMGRSLTATELFHGVLRLEQALTTGGGWQDQIGGAIDGVKLITTQAGLVPDASIHYVPQDVLDPRRNGGSTLLYYTGITRLAKNILQQVVGRYLDRDRAALATLRQLHALGPKVSQAMARKDMAAFGQLIDTAWRLNKQLDPDSSNAAIEELLARIGPHIHGAKLLGAGGGGFLVIICKGPADATAVRTMLTSQPPNPRARFFEFDISDEGLVVTVC